MKRLASQLSLIFAALVAAPAALAGSEVLKCVDAAGHVTLTDQPCESGAQVTRLVNGSSADTAQETPSLAAEQLQAQPQAAAGARHPRASAMLRQQNWRPRVTQHDRPLASDVATLKAARAQLMLIDADRPHRPTLATIQ